MDKREKFINKATDKFGGKFDYSNVNYINSLINIDIRCVEHDILFSQKPSEHIRGKNGCNLCTRNPKIDTDFFINKAKSIHGDRYDYSKTIYINSHTKVKVICREHGEFSVLPNNHYKQNCPKCYDAKRSIDSDIFKLKANSIHNNKYDYSVSDYNNSKSIIKIICDEHGEFEQKPNDHLSGKGCPKCGLRYDK